MRRRKASPEQRNVVGTEAAAGRCYRDLYGTSRAWNIWAVIRSAVEKRGFAPLEELRLASEHAVRSVFGYVPAGAEWEGYNALSEEPYDISPFVAIRRRFLRGQGREEIERRILKEVKKK